MFEQGKAALRRSKNPAYAERYFVGNGLDVGAGNDPISNYREQYPLMGDVRAWDMADGDAMLLDGVAYNSFDFVVSSHCLEHLCSPMIALSNWLHVVRPGGHIVVTVPDEDMYERGQWPSRHGVGHLHSFRIGRKDTWSPVSVDVLALSAPFSTIAKGINVALITEHFDPRLPPEQDQTMGPAECAIEFILRKL